MKQGLKILVASVIVTAAALLTACGGGGGGGGGNNASTPGGCVYDANGNCIAGTGAAGYVGDGQWQGRLMVNNIGMFKSFAYDNGLCAQNECDTLSAYVNLQISLRNGGCLPGPGNFSLSTFMQSYPGRTLSRRTDAYVNAGNNGFFLNYINSGNTGIVPTGAPGLPTQVNTQWVNNTHQLINVQIIYRGVQIAAGQLSGIAQYTPVAQPAGMCANSGYGTGYGYGGGAGYGAGYGYTGGGYGAGYGYGNPGYGYTPGYVGGEFFIYRSGRRY